MKTLIAYLLRLSLHLFTVLPVHFLNLKKYICRCLILRMYLPIANELQLVSRGNYK